MKEGGRRGVRERFEDAAQLALKTEEGASRSWKDQGNRFSPEASRRNAALLTP